MLSMNEIIVCELLLGAALMALVFASFADTNLIADSSSKSNQDPQADGFKGATRTGHALTEISCLMYMSVLAGDYYWAKVTGAATVPSEK
jgi:hypothetical protein